MLNKKNFSHARSWNSSKSVEAFLSSPLWLELYIYIDIYVYCKITYLYVLSF